MISSLSLSLSFPIGIVAWVYSDFEQDNHWIMIILLEDDRGQKLSKQMERNYLGFLNNKL